MTKTEIAIVRSTASALYLEPSAALARYVAMATRLRRSTTGDSTARLSSWRAIGVRLEVAGLRYLAAAARAVTTELAARR